MSKKPPMIEFEFAGELCRAKPSLDTVLRIESQCDKGLMQLTSEISDLKISMKDFITVLYHMVIQTKKKIEFIEVGEAVVNDGMGEYMKPVAEFLSGTFVGAKGMREFAADNDEEEMDPNE